MVADQGEPTMKCLQRNIIYKCPKKSEEENIKFMFRMMGQNDIIDELAKDRR